MSTRGDHVHDLLRARGDDHLLRPDRPAERDLHAAADLLHERPVPLARAVLQSDPPLLAQHLAHSANSVTGKIAGSGRPPAKEIMPGRWVSLNSSRIGDGLIASAAWENR